ncbi:hypothetical protein SORBI_3003G165401 [Sorghum bicolor]|nr:hypothetical protein SORBI_3003G165401 [Sorghum bicolor]
MANHTNTTATATAAGSADHEPHHHHVHYHNIPSIQQGKLRSSSSHYPLSWHRIFFAQVHDMEVTREVELSIDVGSKGWEQDVILRSEFNAKVCSVFASFRVVHSVVWSMSQ